MKTAIVSTANQISGWPIPFFASLRQVLATVVNEVFSNTSLALLQSRLQEMIIAYQAQGSLTSAVVINRVGPTTAIYDGTGALVTPADPNVYFVFTGAAGQISFTVKALANG